MTKRPGPSLKRGARKLAKDEAALFQTAMRDAAPLEDRPAIEPGIEPGIEITEEEESATPATLRNRAPRPPVVPPAAPNAAKPRPLPPLDHGAAPGLDRRTATRLRRGQIKIDGRLDLHGMTQDEAHRALAAFLGDAQARGLRCVIVITGKGGVLLDAVPRWLNEAPSRARVLSFSLAQPKHGGGGALYVYLRKTK